MMQGNIPYPLKTVKNLDLSYKTDLDFGIVLERRPYFKKKKQRNKSDKINLTPQK